MKLTAGEIQTAIYRKGRYIPEEETPATLSRYLRKLKDQFASDNIFYRFPNKNGANGKRTHTFADLSHPINTDTIDTTDTAVSQVAEVSADLEGVGDE